MIKYNINVLFLNITLIINISVKIDWSHSLTLTISLTQSLTLKCIDLYNGVQHFGPHEAVVHSNVSGIPVLTTDNNQHLLSWLVNIHTPSLLLLCFS